jgi:trans-AT polyketide synthase/acyltransferase/oxidoreductase domain-containing protein
MEHNDLKENEIDLFKYPLGDPSFMNDYNVKYPLYIGSMSRGISSVELITNLANHNILGSFGSGGLSMDKLEAVLIKLSTLKNSYCVNIIHNPFYEHIEKSTIDLFLKYKVTTIEASAFMTLTPQIVRYRALGLHTHKIIVKVSRIELAEKFMKPAPIQILQHLVTQGLITEKEALAAQHVPIATDITIEADSAGHTDNRPLHVILPLLISLRNKICHESKYAKKIRIGAAGGIGCPVAAYGAFMMGADYVVTGTINQISRESGTCDTVRKLLSKATYFDVIMCPAPDMFAEGSQVQVLKKGTMFALNAKKLYDIYRQYNKLEDIPVEIMDRLEKTLFKQSIDSVWNETVDFYNTIGESKNIENAQKNGKHKMALIFKWYLSKSSGWASCGNEQRVLDYQIWCGPCIGTFNNWVKDTYLDCNVTGVFPSIVDISSKLMEDVIKIFH